MRNDLQLQACGCKFGGLNRRSEVERLKDNGFIPETSAKDVLNPPVVE